MSAEAILPSIIIIIIVLIIVQQYGSGYPGPECFKTITINYNGKSAQATIMDEVRL